MHKILESILTLIRTLILTLATFDYNFLRNIYFFNILLNSNYYVWYTYLLFTYVTYFIYSVYGSMLSETAIRCVYEQWEYLGYCFDVFVKFY